MSDDRRRGAICGTHETYTVVSALRCPVCRLEKAERERDEARTRLTFIHLLDSLESDGLSQLGVFFAARAAAKVKQ